MSVVIAVKACCAVRNRFAPEGAAAFSGAAGRFRTNDDSTLCMKWLCGRLADFATGHSQIQPASHPEEFGTGTGWTQHLSRFRITAMETAEVPQALQHTWSGHARTHVSERYKKLLRQREWRLEWEEKVGMGFDLPAQPVGLRGLLIQFPKVG